MDTMTPLFAMALAPVLQPWGLIAAGAAMVVEAKLSSAESYIALFLFCVLASASYLAIEIYAGHMSEVARRLGIGRSTLYRKVREQGLEDVLKGGADDTDEPSAQVA